VERINYEIENREAIIAAIAAAGKVIVEDIMIDIVDGRHTNCFFMVVDAPPAEVEEKESE